MMTEEKVIATARMQYRAAFRAMAASRTPWAIYLGSCSPVLLMRGAPGSEQLTLLVRDVQAMAEQTMINALSAA